MTQTAVDRALPEGPVVELFCACHGTVKMAEVVNGELVVKDKRHGKRHVLVLDKIPPSPLFLSLTTE